MVDNNAHLSKFMQIDGKQKHTSSYTKSLHMAGSKLVIVNLTRPQGYKTFLCSTQLSMKLICSLMLTCQQLLAC